jgi:tetratricopeptide (TPR) repeat protein
MNIWLPPYRICVLKKDKNAMQALVNALEKNLIWEIIYTESLWEACFIAINCGVHAVLVNDIPHEHDISLDMFDELRFFACRKLPIPYMLIRYSAERAEKKISPYPLSKSIKSAGIINSIKMELTNIESEISDKSSAFTKYSEFQFTSFIKNGYETPGSILTNAFSSKYLLHASLWAHSMQQKISDAAVLLEQTVAAYPDSPFVQGSAAIFYYQQQKREKARESLDRFLKANHTNPLIFYLGSMLAAQYQDLDNQGKLLEMMNKNFPNSYLTLLTSAIWNCRNEKLDLGVSQLFGCIEKMPYDFVAATELIKSLSIKKHHGLYTGVKNYVSSFALKTALNQYVYTNLLGLKSD